MCTGWQADGPGRSVLSSSYPVAAAMVGMERKNETRAPRVAGEARRLPRGDGAHGARDAGKKSRSDLRSADPQRLGQVMRSISVVRGARKTHRPPT